MSSKKVGFAFGGTWAYEGDGVQVALAWDFPVSALSLDGDIDKPNICDECFDLLARYE